MRCKQVQQSLSVRSTSVQEPDEATRRHLGTCAQCAGFLSGLQRLESTINTWETATPPGLEARILSSLNAETPSAQRSGTGRYSRLQPSPFGLREKLAMGKRLSWGGAALIAGIALTVNLQMSRANTTLNRMGQAAKGVRSVHLIGWSCELLPEIGESVERGTVHSVGDGFPHRVEGWITDGHWRESQDYDVTIYSQGKVWKNGEPAPNEKKPPLLSSFAFRAITGENPFGKGVEYDTHTPGDSVQADRPVTELILESKNTSGTDSESATPERRHFWVDSSTYLPIRMETLRFEHDRWALTAILWFDYNRPVPAALFNPATVKAERHTPIDTPPSSRDIYRLTEAQRAKYLANISLLNEDQARIDALPNLTLEERNRRKVEAGKAFHERVSRILDPDQQKLWDGWNPALAEMALKLLTPQQREEDARWRVEQQKLFDQWICTQDDRTQQLLKGRKAF